MAQVFPHQSSDASNSIERGNRKHRRLHSNDYQKTRSSKDHNIHSDTSRWNATFKVSSVISGVKYIYATYPFSIFFILFIVFKIVLICLVLYIDTFDPYVSVDSIELIDAIDSRYYRRICYASTFVSIPVLINFLISTSNKISDLYSGNGVLSKEFMRKSLLILSILITLPVGTIISLVTTSTHTKVLAYIIFNVSGLPATMCSLLVAVNDNNNESIWRTTRLFPLFFMLCAGTLLWLPSLRMHPSSGAYASLVASYILYYGAIIGFVTILALSWKPLIIQYYNAKPISTRDFVTIAYTSTLPVAYIVFAGGTAAYGESSDPIKPSYIYIHFLMYTKLAIFLGFCTASSRFVLNQVAFTEQYVKVFMNKQEELNVLSRKLRTEKERNYRLLSQMLPNKCIRILQEGGSVEPELFEEVTMFYSDIEGFTKIADKAHPLLVVELLNKLYSVMDYISALFPSLYKIETIGDAYVCAAGVPERNSNHAYDIADFAIICSRLIQFVQNPANRMPIRIRIGCHSGHIMAGIVGTKMPRYCLFGENCTITSKLESTGEAGRIHMSEELAKVLIASNMYEVEERGKVEIEGRGLVTTYFLIGTTKLNVNASDDRIMQVMGEVTSLLHDKESYNIADSLTSSISSYSVSDDGAVPICRKRITNSSMASNHPSFDSMTVSSGDADNGEKESTLYGNDVSKDADVEITSTFLIIDDSTVIQKKHRKLLLSSFPGCTVMEADNGLSALELMESVGYINIDVLLVDQMMPVMTGVEFILAVTQRGYTGCIIGVIGDYSYSDSFKAACNQIPAAVLVKPITHGSLKLIINCFE